jgi:hypothetical protein
MMINLAYADGESIVEDNPELFRVHLGLEKRIEIFKGTSMFKTLQYFRKFLQFEVRSGVSMYQLETAVRKLQMGNDLTTETILNIFHDFNQFVSKGDHQTILRVLYLFPKSTEGISLLANGLFSQNKKICKLTLSIFKKIKAN